MIRDPDYRRAVVEGVDVVCHTGTWGSFWGNGVQERTDFEPARDLVDGAPPFLAAPRPADRRRHLQPTIGAAAGGARKRGPGQSGL